MNSKPKKPALKFDPSRAAAIEAIIAVWQGETMLDQSQFNAMPPEQAARAFRLARETIRNEDRFAKIIKPHTQKPPKANVRAIIYLGFYEITMDGAASYGVVHDLVNLAKSDTQTKSASGFINAILRQAEDYIGDLPDGDSFDKPLRRHLTQAYGRSHVDKINNVQMTQAPIDIRLKPNMNVDEWAKRLGGKPMAQFHAVRLPMGVRISELEGFENGDWWVQDIAATIAVDCFDLPNEKKTLDLCAAPGGKTMQLAAMGAHVTAVELNPDRATRITQNLLRTQLTARLEVSDALDFTEGGFDQILLDAPCTATGTFRRHPDLRYAKTLKRMQDLQPIQALLLEHAFDLLAVGGELVYVTCSMLPEEGEAQLETFLAANPSAQTVELDPKRFGLSHQGAPYLRSFPSDWVKFGGLDGFFIAKITKTV